MARLTGPDEPADGGAGRGEADIRREAVDWCARLCSGEATADDVAAWQAWLRADPEHQRAWKPFETLQATLRRIPSQVAASTLRTARRRRRRVLRDLYGIAGVGLLAGLSWRFAAPDGGVRALLADHRTGPGESAVVELPDGSRLTLNTRTAVDVAFDAASRLVVLREGEILVETASARAGGDGARRDSRPFLVDTPQGRIHALGTRLTVRAIGEQTVCSVLQDAVDVRASRRPDLVTRLTAGRQVAFTRQRVGTPQPADPLYADWVGGSLVVNGWRLEDVVRELARYRRGRLACDPAVADLVISGALPTTDTDKALAVIARAFPVRIVRITGYWVRVVPA
ncbi:MAG: FecR domain-containing protein [Burkholderiaceae bacterium]